jgi:Protein of unknown function (DUF1501)
MSKSKSNLSRRSFLQGSVSGAGYLYLAKLAIMESMLTGIVNRAEAEVLQNVSPRNYINLLMPGGQIRFVFDQWVKTESSELLVPNPMVATALESDTTKVTNPLYKTIEHNGIHLPHMFGFNVNTSQGSTALTSLADNMLVIRGYGSGVDGHPGNALKQMAPLAGASTITGLAADYSNKKFGAVRWPDRGDYGTFFSAQGKSVNIISNSNNIFRSLLTSFIQDRNLASNTLTDRHKNLMATARERLNAYAKSDAVGSKLVVDNLKKSMELLSEGVGDIEGEWIEMSNRYKSIINGASRQLFLDTKGLNQNLQFVPTTNDQSKEFGYWNLGGIASSYLRTGAPTDFIKSTSRLDDAVAIGFALSEFLINRNYTNSIELTAGGIMMYDILGYKQNGQTNIINHIVRDTHETGAISSVILSTAVFRGISAGILELSQKLGPEKWGNTVLQLSSEFSRSPRKNGDGSDHGFNSMVTSVFSGAIKKPMVVGNIEKNHRDWGTHGERAPITGYNQAGVPTVAMAASTVAAMLKVPENPFANTAASLVTEKNGVIEYASFGKGKIIETK